VEARADYARDLERLYLERRRASAERPILTTEERSASDEAVLAFRGALVLDQLHAELGGARMYAALRELVAAHRAGDRLATPEDLLVELRERAPSAAGFDSWKDEWLAGTALPELRLDEVRLEAEGDGYRLRGRLANAGSGSGRVELAAIRAGSGVGARRVLPIAPGRPTAIDWRLDFRPEKIVLDPEVRLVQIHRNDEGVALAGLLPGNPNPPARTGV
jgi:hypothetical protein